MLNLKVKFYGYYIYIFCREYELEKMKFNILLKTDLI